MCGKTSWKRVWEIHTSRKLSLCEICEIWVLCQMFVDQNFCPPVGFWDSCLPGGGGGVDTLNMEHKPNSPEHIYLDMEMFFFKKRWPCKKDAPKSMIFWSHWGFPSIFGKTLAFGLRWPFFNFGKKGRGRIINWENQISLM